MRNGDHGCWHPSTRLGIAPDLSGKNFKLAPDLKTMTALIREIISCSRSIALGLACAGGLLAADSKDGRMEYPPEAHAPVIHSLSELPPCPGPFDSSVESLRKFQCPEWFRDAKFGIWAHWGPQAVPQDGDWYAHRLYNEGRIFYKNHIAEYGHPSKSGYKDIIPLWKAEKWDADRLMALYKAAGAHYFMPRRSTMTISTTGIASTISGTPS
jgi:Alpha-L-fucosidase